MKNCFLIPSWNLLLQLLFSCPPTMPFCEGAVSIFLMTSLQALGALLLSAPAVRLNKPPQPLLTRQVLHPRPRWFMIMFLVLDVPKLDIP